MIHEPFADAIIVAAGASRRMHGRDKLREPLGGRPLLAWTLDAVAAARSVGRLIVVGPPEGLDELGEQAWMQAHDAVLTPGGDRRQDSVAAGLALASAEVVLVHDGARPLVTAGLVDSVALAARAGAAIPIVPITETIKRLRQTGGSTDGQEIGPELVERRFVLGTVERSALGAAQTPQGARRELLAAALQRATSEGHAYTDEAAALEAAGVEVIAITGEPTNIKITHPADLELAEALVERRLGLPRSALGSDSHPFGPEDGLVLGGIHIAEAPRLYGHSDGDAALHAVADGLLAASGLGDLGRQFPAGRPETKGADSATLLEAVIRRVDQAGWRPVFVDLTIVGARPRLGSELLEAMRTRIAALLGIDRASVAAKASTGNYGGAEGAGLAISASAVVTLVRR
ncbi:MAG: 2-C-methyl-D-erythritol 2,4-cyclodiphosphate synthase [Candidatus Limnocylindrales bacterium]